MLCDFYISTWISYSTSMYFQKIFIKFVDTCYITGPCYSLTKVYSFSAISSSWLSSMSDGFRNSVSSLNTVGSLVVESARGPGTTNDQRPAL